MSRIELDMDGRQILMVMCEGNPGALNVMMSLMSRNAKIDPDSFLGPYSAITQLDELGIYGPHIWMAYKDICGEDIPKLIALLRAVQLGILSNSVVKEVVLVSRSTVKVALDIDEIYEAVCQELPNFNKQ